jgi:hypothetical protein
MVDNHFPFTSLLAKDVGGSNHHNFCAFTISNSVLIALSQYQKNRCLKCCGEY